ncbi:MAG: DUF4296 domain-containing protein [Prevotellaceae bacterium]|jgi:hypothetical protein|nr:DUF4296 domain-containing protein [Prevotellaceae bacterium]
MKKIYLIFALIACISCSNKKNIPEKILVEIIYKIHITDAVLTTRESSIYYRDSMRIYEPIIEQYGYKFDDLRRTLLDYATKDGKLQSVHDKVAKKIAAEKAIYQPLARIEKLSENMNVGADSVSIVSKTFNKRNIEVRLSEQGVYDVSASYFFFKNDSTKNPKMVVWLESKAHKDSIVAKQEISLVKDTVFTDYSIRVNFNDPNFNLLKIYWLDFDASPDDLLKSTAAKPTTATSTAKPQTNNRISNPKPVTKPKNPKTKSVKDTVTKQHFIIKRMTVKYNFEESDSTKLNVNDDFIGPMPAGFQPDSAINTTDSVAVKTEKPVNAADPDLSKPINPEPAEIETRSKPTRKQNVKLLNPVKDIIPQKKI